MDFEQALRNENTVVLKEGRDVDALGLSEDVTPKRALSANARMTGVGAGTSTERTRRSSENTSQSATKGAPGQMQTTKPQPGKVQTGSNSGAGASGVRSPASASAQSPSPAASSSISPNPNPSAGATLGQNLAQTRSRSRSPSGASSSSQERVFDMEDPYAGDVQTKRRSLLRSAGTASSPDLKTLLRIEKAKKDGSGQAGARSGSGGESRGAHAAAALEQQQKRARSSTTSERPSKTKQSTVRIPNNRISSAQNSPVGSDWGGNGARQRSDTLLSKVS